MTVPRPLHATVSFLSLATYLVVSTPADASYLSHRGAQSLSQAEVLSVDPRFETVEVREPREQCRLVPVRETARVVYTDRTTSRSRTPTVVGAILGGALGHSVGNGKKNKKIGTAVGAILGGTIGSDISRRNHDRRWGANTGHDSAYSGRRHVSQRTERVCEVVSHVRTEERISGYDVAYAYGGETYTTVLDYDPGRYLEVSVSVTPVP